MTILFFLANACYKSPCQNSGTCLNVHDDYWCKCTNDYYGKIEFFMDIFILICCVLGINCQTSK